MSIGAVNREAAVLRGLHTLNFARSPNASLLAFGTNVRYCPGTRLATLKLYCDAFLLSRSARCGHWSWTVLSDITATTVRRDVATRAHKCGLMLDARGPKSMFPTLGLFVRIPQGLGAYIRRSPEWRGNFWITLPVLFLRSVGTIRDI